MAWESTEFIAVSLQFLHCDNHRTSVRKIEQITAWYPEYIEKLINTYNELKRMTYHKKTRFLTRIIEAKHLN